MNAAALANEPQCINAMQADAELRDLCRETILKIKQYRYSYNFTWLGVPIIQLPPDVLAMQQLIWKVQPDLIIETGVAHGGSLVFYASLLELLGHAFLAQDWRFEVDRESEARLLFTVAPEGFLRCVKE